ncbi:MAG: hypothetical protein EAY75_11655 [Bacteroidetes bacterium]|nr:MAG: hypothetical protein EAY75_11655 [Bacteroidota bacterium]
MVAINWMAYIFMVATNMMAVMLPLNQMDTGAISALYPNKFVPAGFTFAIWGLIYLLLLAHLVFCTWTLRLPLAARGTSGALIAAIHPLFVLSCAFNAGWLVAWHYLQVPLSLGIMLGLFGCLLAIFNRISRSEKTCALTYIQHVTLETPFIIYFAWINVALMANTSALLVHAGWEGIPLQAWQWSCILIGTAAAVGIWMALYWLRPAFTAVIVWALFGVYSAQAPGNASIGQVALAAMAACVVAAAIGFWKKRSLVLNNVQPSRSKRRFLQ